VLSIGVIRSERFRRLSKEGFWIVIGQVATVLSALALVRVLTEYLEPAQYGQLALGLTVAGLVNQVVMGGVTAGIGRFYSIAAEKNDLPGYGPGRSWLCAQQSRFCERAFKKIILQRHLRLERRIVGAAGTPPGCLLFHQKLLIARPVSVRHCARSFRLYRYSDLRGQFSSHLQLQSD